MIDQVREFVGETREAAVKSAAAHFGVPAEQLEIFPMPETLRVAGLGSRVLVLALPKQPEAQLGDVGRFVRTLLEQLGLDRGLRIDESDEEGKVVVRVQSAKLEEAERKIGGVEASLAHLADRAAQQLIDEEASAIVVIAREPRGGGGRDAGRRRPGGDRGGDRGGERGRGGASGEEADLEAQARRTAEEVRRSGEAQVLAPMGSRQRWVVHNAIKDIDGVTSQSIGEGDDKRVKILPD